MRRVNKSLFFRNEDWDWYLFLSIFLYQSIPSIYNSYSIHLIGNAIPDENSLSIASQWQFVQIFVEIIQEGIVLPIFFFVGSKFKNGDVELIKQRINSSLKIILFFLTPFILILYFQADSFVELINTPKEIANPTSIYLKIKVWSLFFGVANLALITILESLRKKRLLIKLMILKLILVIIFDSLYFGGFEYSLGLGIKGVAISNLIVEGLMFLAIVIYLKHRMNLSFFSSYLYVKKEELNLFGKISLGIVVESSVKNIAYFTMIVTLINSIGVKQIAGYYLSMHLYWSFLLVPIIAFSDTLKVLIANELNDTLKVKNLLKFGVGIGIILIFMWTLLFPFSDEVFAFFNKDEELSGFGKRAFVILFIPYGMLGINMIIDSVFYGLGKTKYLAYQSIITNVLVYFTAFVLYKAEIWTPSFEGILCLFAIGIIVDSILTLIYMKKVLK